MTADLSPQAYADLTRLSHELTARTGLVRVTGVSVIRALIDELAGDDVLFERVAERLERGA